MDHFAIHIPTPEKEPETLQYENSIHRSPFYNLRNNDPDMIGLGPYHHNDPSPCGQNFKDRPVSFFLSGSETPRNELLIAVAEMSPLLMSYYKQLPEKWKDPSTFNEMMLTDGCTLLEILRAMAAYYSGQMFTFGDDRDLLSFTKDVLQMENQLPLPLLTKLMALQAGKPEDGETTKKLCSLIHRALLPWTPLHTDNIKGVHVLDVCMKIFILPRKPPQPTLPTFAPKFPFVRASSAPAVAVLSYDILKIPSASELVVDGVTFKRSETASLTDVQFDSHGLFTGPTLSLPRIVVDHTMKPVFSNLLAFERLHNTGHRRSELTSYVVFMSNLLKSADDVKILESARIIEHCLYSDEAVAKLFNDLSRDIPLDPCSDLAATAREIHDYCRQGVFRCPAAALRRFSLLSFTLQALSAAAAVFTILSYYKSSS